MKEVLKLVIKLFKRTMLVLATTFLFSGFATPGLTSASTTTAPNLRSVSTFGLLGATTTVTVQTAVYGNLGSGGQTGSATVTGSTYIAPDPAYTTAFIDLGTAINEADAQTTTSTVITDIGGLTLTPGVYTSTGAVNIGSNMTLSGNGVYIFQINGAFTTAAGTRVTLTNGADECSIFWVANVATIGANSTLEGTLMSKSAITLGDTSVTDGRILAQTAVTANAANTVITVPSCATPPTVTPPTVTPPTVTPPTVTPPTVTPPTVTPPTVTPPTVTPPTVTPPTVTPPTVTPPTVTPVVAVPVLSSGKSMCNYLLSVKLVPNSGLIIHAKLLNGKNETGTWDFNVGGKTYQIGGNEDITYAVSTAPVGTYKVSAQFVPNGETPLCIKSIIVTVPTITGGQLPDTATPWYNILLMGGALTLIGAAGVSLGQGRRRHH
jgi:hypothetical protein